MTPAEYAAIVRAIEDQLPRPMRRPDGQVRLVHPADVADRLANRWTYVITDRRPI